MTYNPNELNCSYCGTPLTSNEIQYIERGTAVRCKACGSILTIQSFEDVNLDSTESRFPSQQPPRRVYQSPPKRGTGALIFFLGFAILSLGLYSWIFPIPIFVEGYYGEIFGSIATIWGLSSLRREVVNPSGVNIMIIGLVVWCAAWMSWLTYIPILSDFYYGEVAGLALIIYGYLKSNR